jgi:hypothetical protein
MFWTNQIRYSKLKQTIQTSYIYIYTKDKHKTETNEAKSKQSVN